MNDVFLKNIKIRTDFTVKKIERKLFLASLKGIMTVKYTIPRVKIGKLKSDYREDTRFLKNLTDKLKEKGYDVWIDNNDLAHYHVLYVSIKTQEKVY